MSSILRRAMLYLGLAPEEDYDELSAIEPELAPEDVRVRPAVEPQAHPQPQPQSQPSTFAPSAARAVPRDDDVGPAAVRTITREAAEASGARVAAAPIPGGASVRTIPVTHAKPHVVAPTSFNDAQIVADRLKGDQPVIMNLQDVDRDLRRRLIDFASGLSYGLAGRMDRVADGVYLLSPANVEVSDDERRRLQERGLHS